ncbi:ABC transporter substrate-binding protein [Xylanimonas allomyrinae]|nr:extracellular solute-binding protein [Xylanimonas allomyrinae]
MTFVEGHGHFMAAMAEKWNEENPDRAIDLQFNVTGWDEMHNQALLTLTSGGDVPDIVDLEIGRFSDFVRGEQILVDLTPFAEPFRDSIVEARLDLYSRDGKLFGLDYHVGATVAFYNAALLEAAGIDWTTIRTWEDYRDAGIAYTEATGRHFGVTETSASWQLQVLLAQLGGELIAPDGTPDLTNEKVVEAITILQDIADQGASSPIPGGQADHEQEGRPAFATGDWAAAIMPMWYAERFLTWQPENAGQWVVAAPPTIDGAVQATVGGGGTGTAVPLASPNADLAAEFVAFAKLSVAGNELVWSELGFDPLNMDVWTDESVTQDPDNAYVQFFANNPFDALNEMGDAIGLLQSQKADAWPIVNTIMTTDVLNNIFENGMSIEDALNQGQADALNQAR